MIGGFWKHTRKTGRSGFQSSSNEVAEKLTREVPQQAAQNRELLKKDEDEKQAAADISTKVENVDR